ncbi:MAG: peptidase [SAR86 cluster bacterium SAR86B]|uniref:Peptidase n=1 Tax=SAR86 cluster bacterium SAR86B TaxID=1123867 RepID=J5KF45_9GAMM|nr:MAG: peptidase [SAR86 cluster bacterium SAR86B]
MVAEFDKYKVDYEYIIKGDEGHGFRSEVANLALYKDYETFLAKHLNKN